jgi:putative two-component system response regulator
MVLPNPSVRVLVVDDEDIVREPLLEALGWFGFTVDGAATVEEALACLEAHDYQLIFCDLVMPGASGFTLLEVVHRRFPELPVIVLTGHATVEITQQAIQLGAQDFIIKPFSVRELPFIIERNLERARLDAQLRQQRTVDLLLETVQALVAAIEAKDRYTAGHSRKVADLAVQFATALGLTETDVFAVRLAGMMHDVGKIGIPESILLKPARLNEEEWDVMRTHPVIGADIVGQIADLRYVSTVVRSHHERWDGTGYPDGLAGDEIPILSRILYICDAYDALLADRAYRPSMGSDGALALIRKQTGTHFEPRLVELLIEQVVPALGPEWHLPDPVATS